jgi:AraC family transcriptional regulator
MRDSTASLAQIALACGFNSQAHMATTFRQRLGVSPVQLRESACSFNPAMSQDDLH